MTHTLQPSATLLQPWRVAASALYWRGSPAGASPATLFSLYLGHKKNKSSRGEKKAKVIIGKKGCRGLQGCSTPGCLPSGTSSMRSFLHSSRVQPVYRRIAHASRTRTGEYRRPCFDATESTPQRPRAQANTESAVRMLQKLTPPRKATP